MTKSELAINAIRAAAGAVSELWCVVDPGHSLMIKYLKRVETRLRYEADALELRCREESGER